MPTQDKIHILMNGGNRKRYTTTLAERALLVLGISFFVVRNCETIYWNELIEYFVWGGMMHESVFPIDLMHKSWYSDLI